MKKVFGLMLLIFLAGCGTREDREQQSQAQPMKFITKERFQVTRVQVFNDNLAYNSQRGVYVILDTKTGKEYVGMSGVGVSELGSHTAGKAILSDER